MKNFLLPTILFLTAIAAIAQPSFNIESLNPKYKDVPMPQNPEVAAFAKYGLYDINLYTGNPNISIPIYTHQGKEMSLPISLTYDASGIKVEQTATNVGLGWNLQFGGVITREINHLPDDLYYDQGIGGGYNYKKIYSPETRYFIKEINDLNITELFSDYNEILPNATLQQADDFAREMWDMWKNDYSYDKIDLEPDTFRLNVNGLSDVILFDYGTAIGDSYKAYAKDNPNIKINAVYEQGENTAKYLAKWIITDEHGFEYHFDKQIMRHYEMEKSYSSDGLPGENHVGIYTRKYVEAWYLEKIVSPNSYDVYTFHYSPGEYFNETHLITNSNYMATSILQHSVCNDCPLNTYTFSNGVTPNINKSLQIHLNEIKYNGSTIFSTEVANRDDKNNSKRYTKLISYNFKGDIIQQIELEQSYFKKFEGQSNTIYNSRLKLDGLSFYGTGANNAKKYAFTYYNPYDIPEINSKAIDYWGYYNGKNTNSSLLIDFSGSIHNNTGNRTQDFNYTINGALRSIFFPTGGRTTFYYEPHKINNYIVGGLRLRKQASFTLDEGTEITEEKYYFYNDLKSIINPPTTPAALLNFHLYNSTGIDQQPLTFHKSSVTYGYESGSINPTMTTINQFSKNIAQQAPNPVTYSKVSEVLFDNGIFQGYVLYEFFNEGGLASGDAGEDGPYQDTEPNNGKLKQKSVYGLHNGNYVLKEKTEYEYDVFINNEYNHKTKGVNIYERESYMTNVLIGLKNSGTYRKGNLFVFTSNVGTLNNGVINWNAYNNLFNDGNFEELTLSFPTAVKHFNPYKHLSFFSKIKSQKHTSFFNGNAISSTTDFIYNSTHHYNVTETVDTFNEGNQPVEYTTRYFYPLDLLNNNPPEVDNVHIQDLVNKNIIGSPIKTEMDKGADPLFTERHFFEAGKLKKISSSKADLDLEDKYTIHQRDSHGNPVITSLGDGLQSYYIWGYNGHYLLGKISPIPEPYDAGNGLQTIFNSTVLGAINTMVSQSNSNSPNNQTIKNEFKTIAENLPNSHVMGYITDPGIGIISVIDSKNDFLDFEYDEHRRLKRTFDKDGHLVAENNYNLRDLVINDDETIVTSPFTFAIIAEREDTTFTFTAEKQTGVNNDFSFVWSLVGESGNLSVSTHPEPHKFDVTYECPEFLNYSSNIVVRCDITDNTTGFTYHPYRNVLYFCSSPLSATSLIVEEVRELNGGQNVFVGLDLYITDLEGGTEGGLDFTWHYKIGNNAYIEIPLNDMTANGMDLSSIRLPVETNTMNAICNATEPITFWVKIQDTLSAAEDLDLYTIPAITVSCSNNPQ